MSDKPTFNLNNPIDVATLLVNKLGSEPRRLQEIINAANGEQILGIPDVLNVLAQVIDNQIVILACLQGIAMPAAQAAHQRQGGLVVPGVSFPRKVQ